MKLNIANSFKGKGLLTKALTMPLLCLLILLCSYFAVTVMALGVMGSFTVQCFNALFVSYRDLFKEKA